MDDFLELGLEVCDKAIDKGFDKLPDRIVSPLGADIPHPHIFHRNKKGQLVNQEGEVQKDNKENREKEHKPGESAGQRAREEGRKPARSATMPVEHDGRPRRRDDYSGDIERRPSRRERNGYAPSQSDRLDPYTPNPNYGTQIAARPRPPMTSRRSQSYQPPRERRRRSRDRTPTLSSSSGSGTPPPENKAAKVASNPYAAGALGAAVGGLLANQAGKASGLDSRRRSKSQSSRSKPGEGDEALVTLAGMALGGVVAAFGSDRYKKFRSRKHEEKVIWEKNQNKEGRQAEEDWERDHRSEESSVGGWAKSQADAYPEQVREARKWQAQVEAGERERERLHRDDVVMMEDNRRREQPRQAKVYRQERVYEPQPGLVTREVVEKIEAPIRYERRSRRRSVDDSRYDDRRREMDMRDNNYGFESRQRDRYVVSGGR